MSAPAPSNVDGNQVLQHAFEDATGRLRVDATVSASVGTVTIQDPDGDLLEVNPDGSINVINTGSTEVEISAADGDNIAISDGVNTLEINANGSINVEQTAPFNINLPTNAATESTLQNLLSELQQKTEPSDTQPISAVSLPLPLGAATESTLSSVDSKLNTLGQKNSLGSVPVVIANDQSLITTSQINDLIPVEFDEINILSKNLDGDPTVVEYKLSASIVATLNITYDSDGDLQNVIRV